MKNQIIMPRIRVLAKHVIYVKELENPEPEDILHSAREVSRLGTDWDHFGIVVEFSNFVVPSLDVRHKVSEELAKIKPKLVGVAVVTQPNILLKVGFKFISRFAGFPSITFHESQESACKTIETISLKRRQNICDSRSETRDRL